MASAAVGVLAAAKLGIDEFGAFSYALATAAMLAGIGLLAIPAILTRDVAQATDPIERGKLLARAVATVAASSVAVATGGVAIASSMHGGKLSTYGFAAWVAVAVFAVANAHGAVILAYLLGCSRFGEWRRTSILRSVMSSGALLISLLLWQSLLGAIGSMAVAETVAWGSVTFGLRGEYRMPSGTTMRGLRVQLTRAWGPAVASIALLLASWVLQSVLLGQPGGSAQVGALGIATRVAQVGAFVPTAFVAAAAPRILAFDRVTGPIFERRVERLASLLAVVASAATLFACPLLPRLGDGYQLAVAPAITLALWIVPSIGNQTTGQMALARRLTRMWWLSDVVLAATLAGLGVVLIPSLGAVGVAFATFFATTVSWLGLRGIVALGDHRASTRSHPEQ